MVLNLTTIAFIYIVFVFFFVKIGNAVPPLFFVIFYM